MADLQALLAERDWLLADGATGTNFFDAGLEAGEAPELWNVDTPDPTGPDKVRALHRGFLNAGADIILTNTFGANARRLRLHNAQDRVHELNEAAAKLARDVAEEFDRPVVIAGSVGPTGDLFAPLGEITAGEARAAFAEQMRGLKAGGADVAWIETMSAPEEIEQAVAAAREVGLPFCYTASFDTAGKTMMGLEPGALPGVAGSGGSGGEPVAVAVGANCGVGASDLLVSISAMIKASPETIIIAKANCGVPEIKGDEVVYTGTPELMANYAQLARDAGARIIGGCCGTTAGHLAAMHAALVDHEPGDAPDLERIVDGIGPLTNPPVDSEVASRRGRRRGARRG